MLCPSFIFLPFLPAYFAQPVVFHAAVYGIEDEYVSPSEWQQAVRQFETISKRELPSEMLVELLQVHEH